MWLIRFLREIFRPFSALCDGLLGQLRDQTPEEIATLTGSVLLTLGLGLLFLRSLEPEAMAVRTHPVLPPPEMKRPVPAPSPPDISGGSARGWDGSTEAVRDLPTSFRNGQRMPSYREGDSSKSIDEVDFIPERDLIVMEDVRVWWESDNVKNGDENDHLFHYAMEGPMRRLIAMVCERGETLRVTEAYSLQKIHTTKSLHKQGRAVDVTWMNKKGERLPLSDLAKMCWAAGFHWVYFERDHIHASVRPDNRR